MKKKMVKVSLILFILLMASNGLSCQTYSSNTPLFEPDNEMDNISTSPEPSMTLTGIDTKRSDVMVILRDLAVDRCYQLTNAFNLKILKTSGWIRSVEEVTYSNNASEELMVVERWYLLDANGYIVEAYSWAGQTENEIQQESVFLYGWYDNVFVNNWYNLESDFNDDGGILRTHSEVDSSLTFASDFCTFLEGSGTAGINAVEYKGNPAIQLLYVIQTDALYDGDLQIKSIYFDLESDLLLGLDTYWVQPNGNLKLVEGTAYPIFKFNADPPLERFAEIWARVPHGDDFVPVEEATP